MEAKIPRLEHAGNHLMELKKILQIGGSACAIIAILSACAPDNPSQQDIHEPAPLVEPSIPLQNCNFSGIFKDPSGKEIKEEMTASINPDSGQICDCPQTITTYLSGEPIVLTLQQCDSADVEGKGLFDFIH